MLNNHLLVSSKLSGKLIPGFLHSSFCSLESIQHHRSRESLLNTIFLLAIKSSLISVWVKDNRSLPKKHYSMLLKKGIGFFYKTYIWCKPGWKDWMDYKVCLKQCSLTAILTSECSWALNLHRFQICKSSLSQYFRSPLKYPTRLLNILKPIWEELLPTLIKNSSKDAIRSLMSLNHACLHFVTSIRLWLVERSSDPKDGVEFTVSMMVTWLSALMCFTTIYRSMK